MSLQAFVTIVKLTGSNELKGGASIDDSGAVSLNNFVTIFNGLVDTPMGRRWEGRSHGTMHVHLAIRDRRSVARLISLRVGNPVDKLARINPAQCKFPVDRPFRCSRLKRDGHDVTRNEAL